MTAVNSLIIILSLITGIIIFVWLFRVKYTGEINRQITQLLNSSVIDTTRRVDFSSLEHLPRPVIKYFHHVLTDKQAYISHAHYQQHGRLKISPSAKRWSKFTASLFISTQPPGFIWQARLLIASIFSIYVTDSLINGIASGKVSMMSILYMDSEKETAELNSAALYRYLAEAVWHPTSLLPTSGIEWTAVDDYTAIAHLAQFNMEISLEFRFNDIGEIIGIYSEERFGRFDNKYIQYPWEGQFADYQQFGHVRIPTRAEVGWHLPQGWWLFWQGEIVAAQFE